MRNLTALTYRPISLTRPVYFAVALTLLAALLAAGYVRNGGGARSETYDGAAPVGPIVPGVSDESRELLTARSAASAPDSAKAGVPGGVAGAGGSSGASVPNGVQRSAAPAPNAPQQALPPLPLAAVDRMIVKTGALTLQLGEAAGGDALATAVQRVSAVLAGIPGAYVAASSTSFRGVTPAVNAAAPAGVSVAREVVAPKPVPVPQPATMATLTLKIPVDSFDQAMLRLRELGSPLSEQVSTQEVTEEHVDLEAQVRNLEATEQQYLRFLERAQRIEEILPIQQRLTDVRGQIERLRGRMTLLQRRSDVSTITVSLIVPAARGAATAAEPRAIRTLREAWGQVAVALQGALDVLIYVGVYALPIAPIVAAVVWWRRRQPRTGAPATAVAGGAI